MADESSKFWVYLNLRTWLFSIFAGALLMWSAWLLYIIIWNSETYPCGVEVPETIAGELDSADQEDNYTVFSGAFSSYACTLEFEVAGDGDEFPPSLNVNIEDEEGRNITGLYSGGPESWHVVLPPNKEVYITVDGHPSSVYPIPYQIYVSRWEVHDEGEPGDSTVGGAVAIEPGIEYDNFYLCAAGDDHQFDIQDYFTFELDEPTLITVTVENAGLSVNDSVNLGLLLDGEGMYETANNTATLIQQANSARLSIDVSRNSGCIDEPALCAGTYQVFVSNTWNAFGSDGEGSASDSCKEPYRLLVEVGR